MRYSRFLAAFTAVAALVLAACTSNESTYKAAGVPTPGSGYDVSKIETVPEVAELVPDSVKADGKLTFGTNLYWAPAGFYASDGRTPVGYDVDLMKAMAKVMGLKPSIQQAEFQSILPGIPSRYEMGVSAFTVTAEREKNFTMIQYYTIGTSWAVAEGNPSDFDPTKLCGTRVGVQSGTLQDDNLRKVAKACGTDKALKVERFDQQSQVTTALMGGKVDAMTADSSVIDYALVQSKGTLETVGDISDTAPQGVVIAKDDPQMAQATQAALQYLMDNGYLNELFEAWDIDIESVATEAVINPVVKE